MFRIFEPNHSDVERLVRIGAQTFAETFVGMQYYTKEIVEGYTSQAFTVDKISKELSDPKITYLLLEAGGELAGYAKLVDRPREECVRSFNAIYLERIYFLKSFQRRGLGQVLMNEVKSRTKNLGFDSMWLSVWEYNIPAVAFYRKHEFEHVGEWDWAFEFAGKRYVDRDWIFVLRVT
jgi:ribosomal protein S18 acetylase RimI-like enzyme